MKKIKSAIKRAEIGIRDRSINRARISAIKTKIKKVLNAVETKAENKQELLNEAAKTIDTVARKGTIHKNKAARLKSRLAKKINNCK